MWFRNLTLFRFPEAAARGLKSLEARLEAHRLRPCGPLELEARGFVSPLGPEEQALTHRVGDFVLLCAAQERRLLPN